MVSILDLPFSNSDFGTESFPFPMTRFLYLPQVLMGAFATG